MNLIGNIGTAITGLSRGDATQMLAKGLGMGDSASALVGAITDASTGNIAGLVQNLNEAISGKEGGISDLMKNIMGGGQQVRSAHHCGSPSEARTAHAESTASAASGPSGFLKGLGNFAKGFGMGMLLGGGNPIAGLAGGALSALAGSTGRRAKAGCICNRARRNKGFLRRLGSALKGIPMLGMAAGAIGVLRTGAKALKGMFKNLLPGMAGLLGGGGLVGNLVGGSVLSGVAKMIGGIGKKLLNRNGGVGGLSANATDAERQKAHDAAPKGSRNMASLPANATFEQILAAFMMDMAEKQEQKIEDMLKKRQAGADGAEGGGRSRGRSKGGLGGILGGVGKIAGGIFGGPIGSAIGGMAGNAVGGLLGGGKGGQNQTSGAGGKGKKESDAIFSQKLEQETKNLQRLLQSLANILKNMNDNAMNTIRKIQ